MQKQIRLRQIDHFARQKLLAPALSPAAPEALRQESGPRKPAELRLSHDDRDALEQTGARWVLPVNARLALVLGRRFAGPWLSREESRGLEQLAQLLAGGLENLEFKREGRGRGAAARALGG